MPERKALKEKSKPARESGGAIASAPTIGGKETNSVMQDIIRLTTNSKGKSSSEGGGETAIRAGKVYA